MSANIPDNVTTSQRLAGELFAVTSLEIEIFDLAKKRYELYLERKKVELEPDMWFHDQQIEKKIEELNDKARKAIGPPPYQVIKAKQKFYMK